MVEQAKIERVLRLLLMLSNGRRWTLDELANRFGLSPRSISRYISTFRKAGFVVECEQGLYSIRKIEKPFREITDLLHFSEEEAYLLLRAIHSIDDTHVLKSNLIKKLYSLYDSDRIIETVTKPEASETIHALVCAIRGQRQVILRQYRSSHGNIVRDRLVEPFDFTANYISLWAFEPESHTCKLFKTARIGKVQMLDKPAEHPSLHRKDPVDVFRISSPTTVRIVLRLTLRACNLLTEEYPLSEQHITRLDDNYWQFDGWVCGFEGVGRFVLGLPGEVYVIESDEFKSFLRQQIKMLQDQG